MSYLNQQELLQTQDTWKRSQIRLPPSLHQAVVDYANDNKMSLNTAIVELLDKGLPTKISTQTILPPSIDQDITLADIMREIQSLKGATP